jgi:hypothetical protein
MSNLINLHQRPIGPGWHSWDLVRNMGGWSYRCGVCGQLPLGLFPSECSGGPR